MGWAIAEQVDKLTEHLRASDVSCAGSNPLWRHFGLTITAAQPEPDGSATDAKLELIQEDMQALRRLVTDGKRRRPLPDDESATEPLQAAASAIGGLLQASQWFVVFGFDGSKRSAEIEYKSFKAKVSAAELDREAFAFGCTVISAAVKDNVYRVRIRELEFEDL